MNFIFHENDDFELHKGAYCVLYGVRCMSMTTSIDRPVKISCGTFLRSLMMNISKAGYSLWSWYLRDLSWNQFFSWKNTWRFFGSTRVEVNKTVLLYRFTTSENMFLFLSNYNFHILQFCFLRFLQDDDVPVFIHLFRSAFAILLLLRYGFLIFVLFSSSNVIYGFNLIVFFFWHLHLTSSLTYVTENCVEWKRKMVIFLLGRSTYRAGR